MRDLTQLPKLALNSFCSLSRPCPCHLLPGSLKHLYYKLNITKSRKPFKIFREDQHMAVKG